MHASLYSRPICLFSFTPPFVLFSYFVLSITHACARDLLSTYLSRLNDAAVAVKIVTDTNCSIEDEKEIGFLKRCRHPRLVLFLGCGYRPSDNAVFLVLEFCEKGTLEEFLYSNTSKASSSGERSSWSTRLRLLCDCAEGMVRTILPLPSLTCRFSVFVKTLRLTCTLSCVRSRPICANIVPYHRRRRRIRLSTFRYISTYSSTRCIGT